MQHIIKNIISTIISNLRNVGLFMCMYKVQKQYIYIKKSSSQFKRRQ